jgi:hypothetical protein
MAFSDAKNLMEKQQNAAERAPKQPSSQDQKIKEVPPLQAKGAPQAAPAAPSSGVGGGRGEKQNSAQSAARTEGNNGKLGALVDDAKTADFYHAQGYAHRKKVTSITHTGYVMPVLCKHVDCQVCLARDSVIFYTLDLLTANHGYSRLERPNHGYSRLGRPNHGYSRLGRQNPKSDAISSESVNCQSGAFQGGDQRLHRGDSQGPHAL